MKLEKPYNKKNLDKAIDNIKKLMVVQEKQKVKYNELLTTLIRHRRAIEPECWINTRDWKKLDSKTKQGIMREERCVKAPSSGYFFEDMKQFPFYAKKQWEKDRELLTKEGR